MREILLVNFDLNIDGIYSSVQSNEMINLKKGLEKDQIVTLQYFERILPNIIDVVDDLLSLTEDSIAFKITKENFKLVKRLVELIKDQNEETEILGIGEDDRFILNKVNQLGIDAYIKNNYKENIALILKEGSYLNEDVLSFSQLYEEGSVEIKDQLGVGIIDNTVTGISETEFFNLALYADGQPIKLEILEGNIKTLIRKNSNLNLMLNFKEIEKREKENINLIIKSAYEIGYKQVACRCNFKDLIKSDNLLINLFNTIDLNGSISEIKDNLEKFEKFLKQLKNVTELKISIDIDDNKLELKELFNCIKRNVGCKTTVYFTNEELKNEIVLNIPSNNIYNMALENGLSMYLEGTYQPHLLNNTVKHVYIKDKINKEMAELLDNFISTNHAIIINKDNYDEDKVGEYSKHIHLIEDGEEKINILLDMGAFNKAYRKVKYKDLNNIKIQDGKELLVKIDDDNDLDELISDLNRFNESGIISKNFVAATLEDRCRWDYKGKCQLKNLPRMQVDKKYNITCCGCSDIKLGSLNTDYLSVVNNIYTHANKEEIKIGCNECSSKDKCSGCKLLPKDISRDKYCSFMRNSVNLDKFNIGSMVIKALKQGSINFKDISVDKFRIIHESFTSIFTHPAKGEKSKVKQNLFLVNIGERNILFDLFTFRIIEVSSIITFLLEGFIKGYEIEEIINFAKRDFSNVDKIEEIIMNCRQELIKFQVIEG